MSDPLDLGNCFASSCSDIPAKFVYLFLTEEREQIISLCKFHSKRIHLTHLNYRPLTPGEEAMVDVMLA